MNSVNLLYVEDDLEIIEDVKYFLKRYFSNIYVANDGVEAFNIFEKEKIDILLLDINIPKIDGLQLAKKIRGIDDEVPIIFLSAYSDEEKLLKAVNLHAYSYLTKPFKLEELITSIKKLISKIPDENETSKIKLDNELFWLKERNELIYENKKIQLTSNEIKIVSHFCENQNRFYSVDEIKDELFGEEIKENTIIQIISRLRKKILATTNCEEFFILNVYNKGYKLK